LYSIVFFILILVSCFHVAFVFLMY